MAQAQNNIQIIISHPTSTLSYIDPTAARSNSLVGVYTIMPSFMLPVQVPNLVGNIRLRVSRKYKHDHPG